MPTIVPLTSNIFDGDFNFPVEVEGSPLITTDEVTRAKLVIRKYAVLTTAYVPLVQGIKDSQFKDCYLINETPSGIQGPILFFNRNFSQIPQPRVESRIVAFTIPGVSQRQVSFITANTIGWNQYGSAAPYTANRVATVNFTYDLNPIAFVPDLTRILFNGAPVDYTGFVFTYTGNKTSTVGGVPVTEPNWTLAGTTSPSISPSEWIVETNFRRWRGPIFETEIVRVRP